MVGLNPLNMSSPALSEDPVLVQSQAHDQVRDQGMTRVIDLKPLTCF